MLKVIRSVLDVCASLAMIAGGSAVVWAVFSQPGGDPAAAGVVQVKSGEDVSSQSAVLSAPADRLYGRSDARVVLVEFSDFQCPYCAKYSKTTLPEIKREYVDTGKVAYLFKHFPLEQIHKSAKRAAELAICATRQRRFMDVHDALFVEPKLVVSSVAEIAGRFGLDQGLLTECLDEPPDELRTDLEDASLLGVNATPMFFAGTVQDDGRIALKRKIAGAAPVAVFKAALDELLRMD